MGVFHIFKILQGVPNDTKGLKYLCELFHYESFWKILYREFLENKSVCLEKDYRMYSESQCRM